MREKPKFIYTNQSYNIDDTFIISINPNISNKNELLSYYNDNLKFPDYFSNNWDSFLDCLRDLSWIPYKHILIQHEAIPNLKKDDLKNYLEILEIAARDWKPNEEHDIKVFFPKKLKEEVERISL